MFLQFVEFEIAINRRGVINYRQIIFSEIYYFAAIWIEQVSIFNHPLVRHRPIESTGTTRSLENLERNVTRQNLKRLSVPLSPLYFVELEKVRRTMLLFLQAF